eukprot:COSAG06_NODE_121_length_23085_cov_7.727791_4_plen_96_part_00
MGSRRTNGEDEGGDGDAQGLLLGAVGRSGLRILLGIDRHEGVAHGGPFFVRGAVSGRKATAAHRLELRPDLSICPLWVLRGAVGNDMGNEHARTY